MLFVDIPPSVSFHLPTRQLVVDRAESLSPLPLAEHPPRGRVDARVRVIFVQPDQKRFHFRQSVRRKASERQDEGEAGGSAFLFARAVFQYLGINPRRSEPLDQVTAKGRVWRMREKGPDIPAP